MRTRRLASISAGLLLASTAVACGLGVVGSLTTEEPGVDASVDRPGEPDAEIDADADAATDGPAVDAAPDGPVLPKCDGGTYADPLTALDASTWLALKDISNGAYPQVDTSAEGPAISLVLPGAVASLGAIWLQPPIAFKAFDVSFRYLMTCPDAGGCADGIAAAWLEAPSAASLQTFTSTATFGLPPGVPGAAVAFDVHQDLATGDPAAPSIALLRLDGGVAGAYDWHTKSAAATSLAGAHDVIVRVRQGTAEVRLDGNVVLTGPVSTGFTGRFGIAASSGAQLGTFVVRSFSATFYECDDP